MSNTIILGEKTEIDIPILLRTRMLIQANSGGGKSWVLRRLAEQLFGKVQVIIIDPEGEFASLREKYGYVLVGQGGETPADVRSAGLVAEKLLELKASAVCDLFESFRKNPQGRHTWVKQFCNALLDAPKKLWHPMILIIDEFHKYVPEKGAGESEASESVIGIGTAGRKRGYCLIGATQRLGKVRKDVTAEMLNRLVGPTFEDVDLERSADLLSVSSTDKKEFFAQMRVLEPGNFFALGRAICKERTLVKIGKVTTTHPEIGSVKYTSEPPPPPDKVRELLPKLADLPKEAEEKRLTLENAQQRIRELQRELKQTQHRTDLNNQIGIGEAEYRKKIQDVENRMRAEVITTESRIKETVAQINRMAEYNNKGLKRLKEQIDIMLEKGSAFTIVTYEKPKLTEIPDMPGFVEVEHRGRRWNISKPSEAQKLNGQLPKPQQKILNAIAWCESVGIVEPEQTAVAFLAGYSYGGGAFNNPRGALRTSGMVEYLGKKIKLTESGRAHAETPEMPLTTRELHEHIMKILETPHQRILYPLLNAYPESLTNDELAKESGYSKGGAFNNPRGRLRSLGLIEYISGDRVRAKSFLFLDD